MRSDRAALRSFAPAALAAAAVLGLAGCIIVPMPGHGLLAGKGAVPEETLESLRSDRATRADVLLRLGEPSERRERDRVLVYGWTVRSGYGYTFFVDWMPIPAEKFAAIRFDDRAVVEDAFLAEARWFTSARGGLDEWIARTAPAAPPPADAPDPGAR